MSFHKWVSKAVYLRGVAVFVSVTHAVPGLAFDFKLTFSHQTVLNKINIIFILVTACYSSR